MPDESARVIFVPVALSEEEAVAVIAACGARMVSLSGFITAENPLVGGAPFEDFVTPLMKIEAAWCKATGQPAPEKEAA